MVIILKQIYSYCRTSNIGSGSILSDTPTSTIEGTENVAPPLSSINITPVTFTPSGGKRTLANATADDQQTGRNSPDRSKRQVVNQQEHKRDETIEATASSLPLLVEGNGVLSPLPSHTSLQDNNRSSIGPQASLDVQSKSSPLNRFAPPPVLNRGPDDRRILTHFIDGHVIYESNKPFPASLFTCCMLAKYFE